MSRVRSLAVLQLEQYDTKRFLASRENTDLAVIKRIKWTPRLKLTRALSYLLGVAGANTVIGAGAKVAERVVWRWVRNRIRTLQRGGLKVVAIAGSYGKTSVKHSAYEYLRHQFRVVATPESFNTVLGIAKCVKYEVDEKTEIFLVEVGAYHRGDITYLLQMVQPQVGVLTGIARQHLERFGSYDNIIMAKLEIAQYMAATGGVLIANGSDSVVKENVEKLRITPRWYSGKSRSEINDEGGRQVAQVLGAKKQDVHVRGVKNRFEMTTERYGMAVIDDSFSSNDVGFMDALAHLGQQTEYMRILVTPGLVELGSESNKIHEQLGRWIIGKADYVMLVGRNQRIESLAKGMARKVKIIYLEKTLDFMQAVKKLKLKKEPLVLLENDVTENY